MSYDPRRVVGHSSSRPPRRPGKTPLYELLLLLVVCATDAFSSQLRPALPVPALWTGVMLAPAFFAPEKVQTLPRRRFFQQDDSQGSAPAAKGTKDCHPLFNAESDCRRPPPHDSLFLIEPLFASHH